MKTARDFVTPAVIAAAWGAWRVRHKGSMGPGPGFVEALEAGFAALAAEGFSIVETGRFDQLTEKAIVGEYMWTPKELHEAIEETIEACAKVAEEMEPEPFTVKGGQSGDEISFGEPNKHRIAASIRSLSRSTREGKTE